MSTKRPMAGPGAFQWNRGGWFGGLMGSTAWLVVGAAVMASRSPIVASIWVACFAASNAFGFRLWACRDRIRPYPAIQALLVAIGAAGLLAFAALDVLGPREAPELVGAPREGYLAMLIVPGLMAQFALMERSSRKAKPTDLA